MPTVLTHAAIPLLVGAGLGTDRVSPRLMIVGALAAMLPDADVAGWWAGVPYDSALGHRGASHSLAASALAGLLAALSTKSLRAPSVTAFLFVSLAMAAHGLADMLTDGGNGIMLLWPFEDSRLFADWRPVHVSPLSPDRFGARAASVFGSELVLLALPAALLGLALRFLLPRPVDSGRRQT